MTRVSPSAPVAAAAAAFLLLLSAPGGPLAVSRRAPAPPVPAGVRNVVLLIADGAGFEHFRAAERRAGHGAPWDRFPVRLAISTAPVGRGPTDSAAAATALATGVRTRRGAVGLGPSGARPLNVLERAEAAGRATGVVTSMPISDATPAAFLAHVRDRADVEGIAREALTRGGVDALFGAGHPWFDRDGRALRRPGPFTAVGGRRAFADLRAGRLRVADADGDGDPDPWTLVETRSQILALAGGPAPKRVLGLAPVARTLAQERAAGAVRPATVPTLAEMTRAALNVLDGDPDGFVLVVEGGAVDWASHGGDTERMLEEMADLADAVTAVLSWRDAAAERAATLVVVTSDHETGGLSAPGLTWTTRAHTDALVPLYALGPGAEALGALAAAGDPRRGPVVDNAALGAFLNRLAAR